jgi:hypothetical protein
MRVGIQRFLRAAVLGGVTFALVVFGGVTPLSSAAPGDGGLVADRPTLNMTTLGSDPDVSLYGLQGTQMLTVPVPKGLTPSALTANVELPANVRGGTILVTQQGRTLSRVELLQADDTPVTIPLTGARIVDETLTFQLRSQLLPASGDCLYDPSIPLQLTDAAIDFSGSEEPPTVVADFLPPVLQRMTIYLPRTPSRAESDAAVRLTTAMVEKYGRQNTEVGIAPLVPDTEPPPSAPLERNVIIREGSNAAVSLQGGDGVPTLLISGPGDQLASQVRMLSSDVASLALSSKAVAGTIDSNTQPPANQASLRDLGQPGVTAVAFNPQVFVGLDQTRLGKPVRSMRVHLKGSYTPLPSTVGGQIVTSVGSRTVDRWAVDSSGAIDRWINIPDDALQRYTNLRVAVDIAGETGRCGEFEPVTLRIDGDTTIDSSVADPPVHAGFQSLPQALMPKVKVGIGQETFTDTVRAAAIMEGLQRLSGRPLDTEVVPLSDAIDSQDPAVLIAANGWDNDKLAPPIRTSTDGELDVESIEGGQPAKLTLETAPRFGSLQTLRDGNRTVIIATSDDAPGLLDAMLSWLDADPSRWASLNGTAVLAPPGRDPVVVNAEAAPADSPSVLSRSQTALWTTGVALVLIASGTAAAILLRRRRPQDGGPLR